MFLKIELAWIFASIVQLLAVSNSATVQFGEFNPTLGNQSATMHDSRDCPITYMIGTQKATWYQASVLCQQSGMELASILSASEDNAIAALLAHYPTTVGAGNGYWTSATRNGALGTEFVWFSGGKPLLYTNFAPGQPDNNGGTEACMEIFLESTDRYSWNDFTCANPTGFICQTKCCN